MGCYHFKRILSGVISETNEGGWMRCLIVANKIIFILVCSKVVLNI